MDRSAGAVVRDSLGNASGGIRLPETEVPILRLVGLNVPTLGNTLPLSAAFCRLLPGLDFFNGEPAGVTPADLWNEPANPLDLYGSKGRFLAKFLDATAEANRASFITQEDASDYAFDAIRWVGAQRRTRD
jgi:alpha/beta hydrolase family protein